MSLCYVSAFLDLNRDSWTSFKRSFEEYFQSFVPLIDMFRNLVNTTYQLIIFIDKTRSNIVKEYINNLSNVLVIEIDEDYLFKNSVLWQRLPKEMEIMNSESYKNLIPHRLSYPEHSNPKYTLINHAKIDFINLAMNMCYCDYFCWVDFGYFALPERIPSAFLDINLFDKEKINYTLINPLSIYDKDIYYTLITAPERIGGFFFFGNRKVLFAYQQLYHTIHQQLQDMGIVDDDQHIALRCYFTQPELFHLHYLGGWHKALTHFQKKTIVDLTSIMNKYNSDKGNGHHNYTLYYDKLFSPLRDHSINLLEIGIGSVNPSIPSNMCGIRGFYQPGASLRGWKEYFENAQIYGCDIDSDILFKEDRITTFYCDQRNETIINTQITNQERMYDIIIDDGLHDFQVNWNMLKLIFSRLKKDGYYIIEDIINFDSTIYQDPFMEKIECKYYKIPNTKNEVDNNILVVRYKGKTII